MRNLSELESDAIRAAARELVEAAAGGLAADPGFPGDLGHVPVHGIFVTLRAGKTLRACVGNWHDDPPVPLKNALANAARAAVTSDRRFAPIEATEIPHLTIEVSILHHLEAIDPDPDNVQIGRHGLLLAHPKGRGLLLPQVAAERDWDARTFLENTSIKAGLRRDAWRWPDSKLTRFEATKLSSPPTE